MATNSPSDLRPGMRVFDAHGQLLGTVKRVLTRDAVLRLPGADLDVLPPETDFPYLEVAAREHHELLYSGFYIPRHAVVDVREADLYLSATRADMENLHWDQRPGFLP